MTTTLYIIFAWIPVLLIGLFCIFVEYKSISERINFVDLYKEYFSRLAYSYLKSGNERVVDKKLYDWLVINAIKVQREVVVSTTTRDWFNPNNQCKEQLIINTLPKFRKNMGPNLLEDKVLKDNIIDVEYILGLSSGLFSELKKNKTKELKNPFKWLQSGVKFFIALPFHLLKWFGIISDNRFGRINENKFIEWISGIITLIGFLGSIVTIFTGWEAFKKIIQNWLK